VILIPVFNEIMIYLYVKHPLFAHFVNNLRFYMFFISIVFCFLCVLKVAFVSLFLSCSGKEENVLSSVENIEEVLEYLKEENRQSNTLKYVAIGAGIVVVALVVLVGFYW